MSLNHDCEVKINVYYDIDVNAFSLYIGENYDLSEVDYSTNIENGEITIKYNSKMHYLLIDNIKHAAMAWNAAIKASLRTFAQAAKDYLNLT